MPWFVICIYVNYCKLCLTIHVVLVQNPNSNEYVDRCMVFSCKLTIPVVLIYQYNRIKNSIEWYIETTPYRANKWVSHPNIGCFLCNMCSISSMWQISTNRSCIKTCNPYLFAFPPLNHRWVWLCLYDIRQRFAMIKSYTCSYITNKQRDV